MVSTETLKVIMDMQDNVSAKVRNVNNTIKQTGQASSAATSQSSAGANKMGSAYDSARSKITNALSQVKNAITSTSNTPIKPRADTSNLTPAQQKMEQLKAKINEINGISAKPRFDYSQVNTADGKIKVVVKDLETLNTKTVKLNVSGGGNELNNISQQLDKVQTRMTRLNNTKVDPFKNLSATGLKTLDGEIATCTTKVNTFSNALNKVGAISPAIGAKLGSAFTNVGNKIKSATNAISGIAGNMSMLQGSIMSAFGAVGVTSLGQFTLGAAQARDKLNAVTTSLTGSEAETKKLNAAIKEATSGGVNGFTSVAKAVQQVGLKFNMSNQQMAQTAPVLNTVGTLARAMGKDSNTAATMMAKAYDGLNGRFIALKNNLGITKEQLLDAGWSGASTDVDGYTKALQTVLDKKPEMQEYLNSYEGQMERTKLAIQGVGREIGEMLLPFIKMLLQGFLSMNEKAPWLTKILVGVALAITVLASASMVLLPILSLLTIEIGGVTIASKLASAASTIWSGVTKAAAAAQALLNAVMSMNPIMIVVLAIIALIAVLVYLYYNNEQVRNAFNNLAATIMGVLGPAWDWLVGALTNVWNALVWIGQVIWGLVFNFNATSQQIMAIVLVWANLIYLYITTGISNAINGFVAWLWNWLVQTGTFIAQMILKWETFKLEIIKKVADTAKNMVTRFIDYIKSLPGKLWTQLQNAINKVKSWASSIVSQMRTTASKMINGFMDYIKQLPSKVWSELMHIKDNIYNAAGSLVSAIMDLGSRMLSSFLGALGINSPGYMAENMGEEMQRLIEHVENTKKPLAKVASNMGSAVTKAFNDSTDFQYNLSGSMDLEMDKSQKEQNELLFDLRRLLIELIEIIGGKEDSSNAVVINNMNNANTSDILSVLKEHITDRDIIREIADSSDFQQIDKRRKYRINNELARHI